MGALVFRHGADEVVSSFAALGISARRCGAGAVIDRLTSTLAFLLILIGAALALTLPVLIVLALVVRTPAAAGWAF